MKIVANLKDEMNVNKECQWVTKAIRNLGNMNIFGSPKEGYGFSNNCKPILSAPSFKYTKINLSSNKSITIE